MRRPSSVILIAVLALSVAAAQVVRADDLDQGSIRKELKASYALIVKGFRRNDPSVWEGFLVSDFKLKLFDGSVRDRQWVVDYVRNNAKT
ncbi:MAG TPA: hypothetical protein VE842_00500, partial [Pyrinomonadaceae bacterium]|nr:hypothetical protein [Pyrinomonadaceae bacterium]